MKRLELKSRILRSKILKLSIYVVGFVAFSCALPSVTEAASGDLRLSGQVVDGSGEAIVGATVVLLYGDSVVSGTAGDFDGIFSIRLGRAEFERYANQYSQSDATESWALSASSIGFGSSRVGVSLAEKTVTGILIVLSEEQVSVEGVTVVAEATESANFRKQAFNDISKVAQRGLSVTNPIEAVRAPEVSRSGSAFSSQIRFSGSSPDYTLNGASIGRDPAHYGMFSVLPSVAISEVGFDDQALDASDASPGQVELKTDRSFSENSSGELTLSGLEAVGGYRKGTERWFVSAALRKSVIDKLVGPQDAQSEKRTIPPTNFQDVFVSSGVRLSSATSLYLDQYHAQDFLAFNTGATATNSAGIDALQHTRNRMFGAHLRNITPSTLFNLKVSAKFDKAVYLANATDSESPEALALDLQDNTTTVRSDADIAFAIGENQITSGVTVSHWSTSNLSLSQNNWNFLPPYSTSDNPYYYQGLVNAQYGELSVTRAGTDMAFFTQFERSAGPWRLRAGLRAQGYDYLSSRADVLMRLALARRLSDNLTTQFSLGTYAEAPLSSLLDPYQVLVRNNLSALSSVSTKIAKVSLSAVTNSKSRYDFSLFAKTIDNLPTLTPTFSDESLAPVSVAMQSNGSQMFLGFTAAYARQGALASIFGERLDIKTGYAFTKVSAQTNNIATNYSEDSPHRYEMDASYHASSAVRISGLFTIRTGNRYTAPFTKSNLSSDLGSAYYASNVASENSTRFPAHINMNLSISYQTGSWVTMANVGNAFNRANPIVSAYDGFVYDAGVLPSLGVTYKF